MRKSSPCACPLRSDEASEAVQHALESWAAVHPLARGVGLLDGQPLFVRLGRHGDQEPLRLSAVAVHRLLRRHGLAGGVPERLAHPHALRAYWATQLLEAGVPVHEVSARLRHVDLRTTARYAAPRPERVDEIAEVLDRRHHAARRAGCGASVTDATGSGGNAPRTTPMCQAGSPGRAGRAQERGRGTVIPPRVGASARELSSPALRSAPGPA